VTFSEKLCKLRSLLGFTMADMGTKLGVSRNLVGMMEREVNPRPPSRPVKLNFGHLVKSAYSGGAISASDVQLLTGETPTESEFYAVKETAQPYKGGRANLKEAREAKGMSIKELCKATGYSELIYKGIEEGSSNMSRKMAERVAKVLDMDVDDLLNGSDHPPSKGVHHGTVGETPNIQLPPGQKARYVPLLSMAQCGAMEHGGMVVFDDAGYTHEGFLALNPTDPNTFAVTLSGDSMMPVFAPGDTAVIYPNKTPRNGSVVLAKLSVEQGDGVMVKLYQQAGHQVVLSSYNPAYPPITRQRQDFVWIYPVASVTKIFPD
jgi:SOS-response transcriptional repressor LexA